MSFISVTHVNCLSQDVMWAPRFQRRNSLHDAHSLHQLGLPNIPSLNALQISQSKGQCHLHSHGGMPGNENEDGRNALSASWVIPLEACPLSYIIIYLSRFMLTKSNNALDKQRKTKHFQLVFRWQRHTDTAPAGHGNCFATPGDQILIARRGLFGPVYEIHIQIQM